MKCDVHGVDGCESQGCAIWKEGESMKVKRFYHKNGFADGTRFLEWKNGRMYIVDENYKRKRSRFFTFKMAMENVADGDWIVKERA